MWLESIGLGLVLFFMMLGLIGAFVPILPGALLVWLAVLVYAVATGFSVIEPGMFVFISIIAIVTGSSDIWMSLLGAKKGGAGGRSMLWGIGGALIGFFLINLVGAVIGYALGIVISELRKRKDLGTALKAGLSGLAGWGASVVVEASGALLIIVLFVWRVFG